MSQSGAPFKVAEPVMLANLERDPNLAVTLPPEIARALLARPIPLQTALLVAAMAPGARAVGAPEPDRLLAVREAAAALKTSEDFVYRNWRRLGLGYRDDDGRLKFPASRLARHVQQKIRHVTAS